MTRVCCFYTPAHWATPRSHWDSRWREKKKTKTKNGCAISLFAPPAGHGSTNNEYFPQVVVPRGDVARTDWPHDHNESNGSSVPPRSVPQVLASLKVRRSSARGVVAWSAHCLLVLFASIGGAVATPPFLTA